MLKILQAGFQQYVNRELPYVQAGFRKGRATRNQTANIYWMREKARKSRKTSNSASLTTLKPLTVWITKNCGKFLKRQEYQTTLPVSCETFMRVRKQRYMEKWTGSKLEQDYKAVYCHPAYLTFMQSTSYKMLGGMNHKLKWRLQGEITVTSDIQNIPPLSQKEKRN